MTTTQHLWTATLAEGDAREDLWREAFGSLTAPVVSPIPEAGRLRGREAQAILKLDLSRLTPGEIERVADKIGARFGMGRAEALAQLRAEGLPLIWDGLLVSCCCGCVAHDDYARPTPEAFSVRLEAELAQLQSGEGFDLKLKPIQAFLLLGLIQVALKHPDARGSYLAVGLDLATQLQTAYCSPGSALEQVAHQGWVGRGGPEATP